MRVEGGAELVKVLNDLSPRVGKRMLREALEAAGEPMRLSMQAKAPRAPGKPDLADNMVMSTARVKSRNEGQAAGVAIGPSAGFYYGFFQEFGTVHHSAQPFMRPSFDGGAPRALADLTRALWAALAARGVSRSTTVDAPVEGGGGRFL